MEIKQQALASYDFKSLSNNQDGLSLNSSGENTDAYSPSIAQAGGPQKTF